MATDPGRVVPFELGPYTGLCFDMTALRAASKHYVGTPLMKLASSLDFDQVFQMAAFGYLHEGKPVSDKVIEKLIEADKTKFFPLKDAVRMALVLGHAEYMPGDVPGEVLAAAVKAKELLRAAAAGQTSTGSSAPPAGSGSTQP
jgi:hypothetical protein